MRAEDQGWYECKVLLLDQQYDTFHNGSWVHLTIHGAWCAGRVPACERVWCVSYLCMSLLPTPLGLSP